MRYILLFTIAFLVGTIGMKVFAADLPIPKPRSVPERCLVTGEQPAPGQTLRVDKRCASGLRWVYQR